jgi:hypothetical protein
VVGGVAARGMPAAACMQHLSACQSVPRVVRHAATRGDGVGVGVGVCLARPAHALALVATASLSSEREQVTCVDERRLREHPLNASHYNTPPQHASATSNIYICICM